MGGDQDKAGCAAEAFFEKPEKLARKRPELYEEMKRYYRMEPREWASND